MFRQLYEEKFMRFPQGKCKAVTFSYDDGVEADLRLLEVLNKNGLKGTFNLNTRLFDCQCWHNRMDEARTIAAFSGGPHEVAMHGDRHIFMDKTPLPEAVRELVVNRTRLEEMFGKIVRGMAYAYNGYTQEIIDILPALGVEYARTTEDTFSFGLPKDFRLWHPTCHHNSPRFKELCAQFFALSPQSEKKHRESKLFYVWGHSYEFDDDGNWDLIEDFAKRAGECKDVWPATNIEIYSYVQAYGRLVFSMDGERVYNPSAIPVWLEIREKTYKIGPGQEVAFDI